MKTHHFTVMCWLAFVLPQLARADLSSAIIKAIPPEKRVVIEADKLAELLRELDAARASGSKLDTTFTTKLEGSIALAHEHGLPLALMLYTQSPDDEVMRLKLASEIVQPDASKSFGWDAFGIMVDGFLASRDAPLNVFKSSPKQQGLDQLVRSSIFESLVSIANPKRATEANFSDASAAKLLEELSNSLRNTELQEIQRDQIARAIDRVKAFQANPPPYLSPKWREAAAQLQSAFNKWAKTPQQSATQQTEPNEKPSVIVQPPAPRTPEAKPTVPTPSEEPTSSTPWSIIIVLIVAAIGLLWLLVKKRK
jgi:hypothetical protein